MNRTLSQNVGRALALTLLVAAGVSGVASAQERRMVRMGSDDRKPARIDVRKPETELTMYRYGPRPVIEAMVNGKGPYRFFLDTGAGGSAITDELAKELGCRVVGKQKVGDPTGSAPIEADVVEIDSLSLGGVTAHGMTLPTLPAARLPQGDDAPQGVFSLREVSGLLVTFDFAGDRILLTQGALPEPDGRTVLAYESPMGIPVLPVTIGGVTFEAHLDTGAPGEFSVPLARADELKLESKPVEVGQGRTVNSVMTIYEAKLVGTVQLGGFTFENPTLKFNDKIPFVNIGSGLLSRYTMTMDRENKRLRLVPNEPASE